MNSRSTVEKNWSWAAAQFEAVSSRYFGPATAPFFRFAGLRRGDQVLDVACGPGTSTRLAGKSVLPGGGVLGVDVSRGMLSLARKKTPPLLRGRLRFKTMDAQKLDFPDEVFDAVLCHLGLMFFPRADRALAEMTRVVKPGGSVSCLVLGTDARMPFTNLMTQLLPPPAPRLDQFSSETVLKRALASAGLRKIATRRLRGTFPVASPEAYWNIVLRAFGKLGPLVLALPEAERLAVKSELFLRLARYKRNGGLNIPYEFVLARGVKP